MIEAAGFGDVTISHARIGGNDRLGNVLARRALGSDEIRIVTAVKPAPVPATHNAAAEAVAIG
jgi:hypothetical protein